MLLELLRKELRDHLLSQRFQVGLLLALVLVSASSFVLSLRYRRETREFSQRVLQTHDFLSKYSHLNRVGGVLQPVKPPSPFVLVEGLPDPTNARTLDSNPLPDLFRPADLAALVAYVFSLLAIVLGFNAINGEKERGTLRLILANPLRRFEVIIAKWAAGMVVLTAALAAAWLVASLVVLIESGTHWTGADALSLTALWFFSMLYCGVFFTLALAFSSLLSRSSVSILASIFSWMLLVFVLPNVSPYVAAQFVRVPSLAALQRDLQYTTSEERDELGRRAMRQMLAESGCASLDSQQVECPRPGGQGKVNFELGDFFGPSEAIRRQIATDPGFRQVYEQLAKESEQVWGEVNRKQEEKADRLRAAWRAKADRQFGLSMRLSCTSPLPPFVYASTDLSLTGLVTRRRFERQVRAYYDVLEKYLWTRYHEEQAKNPAFTINDFLDVGSRPRFTFVASSLSERVVDVLPFAAILGAWNLAFFMFAVLGFFAFDVR